MKHTCKWAASFFLLLMLGLTYTNATPSKTEEKLAIFTPSPELIQQLERVLQQQIRECDFLSRKLNMGHIGYKELIACVNAFDKWYMANESHDDQSPLALPLRRTDRAGRMSHTFRILDHFLGNKIMPYVLALSEDDQAFFMSELISKHVYDIDFTRKLIAAGVPTDIIPLYAVGYNNQKWAQCDIYMMIAQNNKQLYEKGADQYKNSVFYETIRSITLSRSADLRRVLNSNLRVCPQVIKLLATANPELANTREVGLYKNTTALHWLTRTVYAFDMDFVRLLATEKNINIATSSDETPFAIYVRLGRLDSEKSIRLYGDNSSRLNVIKYLLSLGADVNKPASDTSSGETILDFLYACYSDKSLRELGFQPPNIKPTSVNCEQ